MSLERNIDAKDFLKKSSPIKFLRSVLSKFPEYEEHIILELAEEVVHQAKKNIEDGNYHPVWSDEIGSGLGHWTPEFNSRERKSNRNSDHPLIDEGKLLESIKILDANVGSAGAEVKVGSELPYAHILEFGGTNNLGKEIPARPFLTEAMMHVEDDVAFKRAFNKKINAYITAQIHEKLFGK